MMCTGPPRLSEPQTSLELADYEAKKSSPVVSGQAAKRVADALSRPQPHRLLAKVRGFGEMLLGLCPMEICV